jgi:DNA-binding transcriptional MerR regulator
MEKAEGAFLTISELAGSLGLPQHILRYWETRFPQLRPLQRSGNRRYYRPADVALAHRIHQLLNVEGFTVKGAQKALVDGGNGQAVPVAAPDVSSSAAPAPQHAPLYKDDLLTRLLSIRADLARAIGD